MSETGEELEYREHWVYPVVPEERIRTQAIEYVAKQTGLTETWVQRIHDFQWQYTRDCLDNNKTVLMPKLCRFLMRGTMFYHLIIKLEEDCKILEKNRDKQKELLKKCKGAVELTLQRNLVTDLNKQIRSKKKEVDKWRKLMEDKTQKGISRKLKNRKK